MNSQGIKKDICRICLDDNVILDWNTKLYGFCDITYKDCFYKYTQLECLASDPFSTLLCQFCLNGLYNVHSLILKALDSHKYFQETHPNNLQIDHSTNLKEDIKYTPTEFETVLVEKIEVEPIIPEYLVYEHSDEESIIKTVKSNIGKRSQRCRTTTSTSEKQKKIKSHFDKSTKRETTGKKFIRTSDTQTINSVHNLTQSLNKSSRISRIKTTKTTKREVSQHDVFSENQTLDNEKPDDHNKEQIRVLGDELLNDIIKDSSVQGESKVKKKYTQIKKPRMCSICSKILHSKYAVQMHEKTHMENRERKEACKVCGLKFYDKRSLYCHKRIHKENREKNHKCEFCNKAFYDKGGLNIHRRIHLGQMISCSLCTKQYFRQIDLDRHMNSHSATTINSDTKERSRYFVRCIHCDKSILSTSFKSHTAAHLNEPLMKCSLCSKEFFRRGSCVLHVKKVHQKTNEEYNDFIIQYKKNRISHLFLEQKADIQFADK